MTCTGSSTAAATIVRQTSFPTLTRLWTLTALATLPTPSPALPALKHVGQMTLYAFLHFSQHALQPRIQLFTVLCCTLLQLDKQFTKIGQDLIFNNVLDSTAGHRCFALLLLAVEVDIDRRRYHAQPHHGLQRTFQCFLSCFVAGTLHQLFGILHFRGQLRQFVSQLLCVS